VVEDLCLSPEDSGCVPRGLFVFSVSGWVVVGFVDKYDVSAVVVSPSLCCMSSNSEKSIILGTVDGSPSWMILLGTEGLHRKRKYMRHEWRVWP
jgi:hypothetical protein